MGGGRANPNFGMNLNLFFNYRALKRISSVKLKRTSLPANPIQQVANCEEPEERRASTIVPPVPEDLCITPPESVVTSPVVQQLIKPNNVRPDKSSDQTNTLNNDKLEEGSSNDNGIIMSTDNSENADFVYPRMYSSSLNIVIK